MSPKLAEIIIDFSAFPVHRRLSPAESKRVKAVLTWLIFSHDRDYRLTASRLMKLYYMAELRSIEHLGRRLSEVEFVNWNHGPWSQAVAMIADSVHPDIEMERGHTKDGHDAKFYKARVAETEVDLEKDEMDLLDSVIDEWRRRKTVDLVQAAKETDPYKASLYGQTIDLAEYARCWAEL